MKFAETALVASIAILLQGCAMVESQKNVDRVEKTAVELRDLNLAQATTAAVSRTTKPRLSGEEIVLRSQSMLPERFNQRVTYATHGAQSLSEVFDAISTMSGMPIRSSEIVTATQSPGAGASLALPQGNAQSSSGTLTGKVALEFQGTLRGLLDELAGRNEASWRYSSATNSVEFFRFETRTLSVYLPPGTKTVDATISLNGASGSGGGSSGGSGGGSSGGGSATAGNVSVAQTLTVNPWTNILGQIQAILSDGQVSSSNGSSGAPSAGQGGQGNQNLSVSGPAGRASATPELGILTVTARPKVVERVASYVESINQRFAQNVLIDIKVYSLTVDKQASVGFSLDSVYKLLNTNGVSVVGSQPIQPANGTPGRMTISVNNPRSRLYGSELVAQALSQIGNVALQTQGQVLAVNGQPAPFQVANEVNYLASSSSSQAANVGTTTSLTPGSRVVGFTANFLPLILGDNRILLQYQLQLSSLTALTQATSGNASIQTPQISSQSLQQQAFVKDGQSIVLFGFDQNRDSLDSALGLGSASRGARSERQMVVIVLSVNGGRKDA